MTVNELIQKLVELARDGKGQWSVAVKKEDNGDWGDSWSFSWPNGQCDFDVANKEVEFIGD